ncbi:MAG: hypothetical protein WCK67_07480 [bacterium]
MGLAASQGRMLTLTSRKSDLEYRAQIISNRRIMLSMQTSELSRQYSEALNNRIMKVKTDGQELPLSVANLTLVNMKAVYADGSAVPDKTASNVLEEGLRNGVISMQYINKPADAETNNVDWKTSTLINDNLNTADDAAANGKYEYLSAQLQAQDKQMELELKNVETMHKAVETETESVKKVVDKNIEMTFKAFS